VKREVGYGVANGDGMDIEMIAEDNGMGEEANAMGAEHAHLDNV